MTEVVVDGIIYQLQPYGGIPRMFSEILPRMCDMDDQLHVTLFTSGPCRQALPTHPHIHHRPIPRVERLLRPARLWSPVVPIVRGAAQSLYIGGARGRIWHSTYYTMPYQWGRPSWKGPIVVTVVDMIYEKFPQYFVNAAQVIETKKRCIEKADRVIAISNSTKRDILEYFNIPEDKVVVTHLAASEFFKEIPESDKNDFREKFRLGKPFILYVGNRGGYKNFLMLLETYSSWKKRNDFDLISVGGEINWSRDEMNVISKANLRESVKLFTNAGDRELRAFYSCAHAFAYPSLYEGFGIPPLEAMACGTPVIVSNTSSLPEVVGDAGLYFEPSSGEELLDALDRIVYDTNLRKEFVRKELNRSKTFSWQETATKTHSIYRDLL